MVQVTCPKCNREYHLDSKYAGRRLSCKECGKVFRVPGGSGLIGGHQFFHLLLTGSLFLLGFGIRETCSSWGASEIPAQTTCAALETQGLGSNRNVVICNYRWATGYAYGVANHDPYSIGTAFLPILATTQPSDGHQLEGASSETVVDKKFVRGEQIHILVKTETWDPGVEQRMEKNQAIQGMLIKGGADLPPPAAARLRELYPTINLDSVLILQEGDEPTFRGGLIASIVGLLLTVLSIYMLVND